MALNEHRRGARTKHALGAWVRAVQTSALHFFTVCLFGQTAAFNDVYNLMSLGDPHPCMAPPRQGADVSNERIGITKLFGAVRRQA